MTGSEHYQRALILLSEVEQWERDNKVIRIDPLSALALQASQMRKLKQVEMHMIAAGYRKTT